MAKKTPLYENHLYLKARMLDFAGWEMPIQYSGVIEEHNTVRKAAGIFDVSHMGQIEITGPDATQFTQYITTNDVLSLTDGKAMYSLLLNERGTVIDDIIIYQFNPQRFIYVVNASNIDKDLNWIKSHKKGNVKISNLSDNFALIALQGPASENILQKLTAADLSKLASFHFIESNVADAQNCVIARTGYTGEDGFEIFCKPQDAPQIWNSIMANGASFNLKPVGLGARDTLRTEMKYSLYGHEITEDTNPFEAGLSWVVKMDKAGEFIGKKALLDAQKAGIDRRLVGFKMIEKAIPRSGYKIMSKGKEVGFVTSGTLSPSLGEPIGIGFVPIELAKIGSTFLVDIRGKLREAKVVKTPFYKRQLG